MPDRVEDYFTHLPPAFLPAYLDERRRTVERFCMENEAQLRQWLPSSEGSWSRFRAHHRALQLWRALPCGVLLLLLLAAQARFHLRMARTPREDAWVHRGARRWSPSIF